MTINKKRHKDLYKLYEFKKYVFSFYENHKDNLYLLVLILIITGNDKWESKQ